MAIKKVWIDEGCTACALCADICPEVFTMEDEATVIKGITYEDHEQNIKEAAENCPVGVIKYSE
jgi:ferredoxin